MHPLQIVISIRAGHVEAIWLLRPSCNFSKLAGQRRIGPVFLGNSGSCLPAGELTSFAIPLIRCFRVTGVRHSEASRLRRNWGLVCPGPLSVRQLFSSPIVLFNMIFRNRRLRAMELAAGAKRPSKIGPTPPSLRVTETDSRDARPIRFLDVRYRGNMSVPSFAPRTRQCQLTLEPQG